MTAKMDKKLFTETVRLHTSIMDLTTSQSTHFRKSMVHRIQECQNLQFFACQEIELAAQICIVNIFDRVSGLISHVQQGTNLGRGQCKNKVSCS